MTENHPNLEESCLTPYQLFLAVAQSKIRDDSQELWPLNHLIELVNGSEVDLCYRIIMSFASCRPHVDFRPFYNKYKIKLGEDVGGYICDAAESNNLEFLKFLKETEVIPVIDSRVLYNIFKQSNREVIQYVVNMIPIHQYDNEMMAILSHLKKDYDSEDRYLVQMNESELKNYHEFLEKSNIQYRRLQE